MQQVATEIDGRALDRVPASSQPLPRPALSQWRVLVLALLLLDAMAVALAFALAYVLRFKVGLPLLETPQHNLHFYSTLVFVAVPVWLVILAAYRLYDRHYLLGGIHEYAAVINACTIGLVVVVIASFLEPALWISRGWLLIAWGLTIAVLSAERFSVRRGVYRLRQRGLFADPTIIVGGNEEAKALAEHLRSNPLAGLHVVGVVDDALPQGMTIVDGIKVLGRLDDLEFLVQSHGASELLVALTALSREDLIELYRTFAHQRGVHLRMSSGLFEILTTGVRVKHAAGLSLICPEKVRITGIDAAMKAVLDFVGAALGLILTSPLLALVALMVEIDSPGPIFHRRLVLGREGRPFHALKFRTMVVDADALLQKDPELQEQFKQDFKLKVDPRITRVGRFLRRTSLDELPQLVNVLLGQMSLVGPRMIAPEEAVRYGKWRLNLLTVKPGITGPWQVNGRNELSYDQRVSLSMHYIRNYTIWLDLQIIFQTIPVVLGRKGAY